MRLARSRLHTQRRLMDQKLEKLQAFSSAAQPPPSGWIKAIRESLGMTARQMGKILGVSGAAVTKLEERERSKGVTLKDLERAAEILDCRLVYALVPRESLDSTVRRQAQRAARKISVKADHAMKLEEQQVSAAELKAQSETLAKLLLETLDGRLWETDSEQEK